MRRARAKFLKGVFLACVVYLVYLLFAWNSRSYDVHMSYNVIDKDSEILDEKKKRLAIEKIVKNYDDVDIFKVDDSKKSKNNNNDSLRVIDSYQFKIKNYKFDYNHPNLYSQIHD
jgi:hypothetical protein